MILHLQSTPKAAYRFMHFFRRARSFDFAQDRRVAVVKIVAMSFAILLTPQCTSYHVNLMGASYHFTRQYQGRNYTEFNPGIGVGGVNTVGNNNFGVTATYLKNSFNNDSAYIIGHYTNSWLHIGKFMNSTGMLIGIATGYETRYNSSRNQNPIPVAGLMNDMCLYDFCVFQVVAPSYDGMSGFVAGGLRYNFRL